MPSANVLSNEQESNCFKNVTNQLFDIILALSGLNTTGITHILRIFVCLCRGITSQSTIFPLCRDGALTSTVGSCAQGHNTMTPVVIEPRTS